MLALIMTIKNSIIENMHVFTIFNEVTKALAKLSLFLKRKIFFEISSLILL